MPSEALKAETLIGVFPGVADKSLDKSLNYSAKKLSLSIKSTAVL
jgi:hypothetical protein